MARKVSCLVLILAAAGILLVSLTAAAEEKPALTTTLKMLQGVYETGQVVRGELTLLNPSEGWVNVSDLSNPAESLRLVTEDGKTIKPRKPSRFGGAKTKAVGPGGFVGVTFDAGLLFPQLTKPGRYTLRFEKTGFQTQQVPLTMIPAFSAAKKYRLLLTTSAGKIAIQLDPGAAPVAVHNIVSLARTGFYDGASIPKVEKGVALKIRGPVKRQHRIFPVETTKTTLLAGTVLVEPSGPGRARYNLPNLLILLGPKPEWQSAATAVGQVVAGSETLERLSAAGSRRGLKVTSATIEEVK